MKYLVVLGAGESGVGAALLGKAKNWRVYISDFGKIAPKYQDILTENEIDFEEEQHTWELIEGADLVVKSPGIPDKSPLIQKLKAQNTPIISEIEWAAKFTRAKLIGITGSNGKTTTTSLIYHLLKKANLNVGLGGNIGNSFAAMVVEDSFDYYVLELSSFQLEGIKDCAFEIAVLLNISPDHLDRYEYKMENYVQAKLQIQKNSKEDNCIIYNAEDAYFNASAELKNTSAKVLTFGTTADKNAYYTSENLIVQNTYNIHLNDFSLVGKHNYSNALAAMLVGAQLGIEENIVKGALQTFIAIPHRLEKVAVVNGVEYINDSKATNVEATYFALEAMKKPVHWIVGGVDKGNDYSTLIPFVQQKVKSILCLGKDNQKIMDVFGGIIPIINECSSAKQMVEKAAEIAKDGDVVLLSPCCASFDLFKNYEDRGDQFKKEINLLK